MKAALKKIVLGLIWQAVARKCKAEKPVVVAVTGSVGKTSTKEAVAIGLRNSGRAVVKTYGSLNTETGVALSLLGFTQGPKGMGAWARVLLRCVMPPISRYERPPVYVLEFSADRPGDIAFLAGKFDLDVAILTSIVPVHMERYAKFEDLVAEKLSIIQGLKPDGVLIANADDPVQTEALRERSESILWYGNTQKPTKKVGVWMHSVHYEETGLAATIDVVAHRTMDSVGGNQSASFQLSTRLIGKHQLYSPLIAVAVGTVLKVPSKDVVNSLDNLESPAGRGRIIEGRQDIQIIDDTYNASPEAVKAGLAMLKEISGDRRVVAILGNMNELGEMTAQAHADVATFAVGKVDFLVAVGPEGKQMVTAAKAAGQPSHAVISFATPEHLLDKLDQIVKRRDLVYVRGSQNKVFLERVVKALMADPLRLQNYSYDRVSTGTINTRDLLKFL